MEKCHPPRSQEVRVSVGVTSGTFLGANNRRRGFFVPSPIAGRITISERNPAVLDQGFTIHIGGVPVHFCLYLHGTWVQRQLQAISAIGTEVLGVIEVLE